VFGSEFHHFLARDPARETGRNQTEGSGPVRFLCRRSGAAIALFHPDSNSGRQETIACYSDQMSPKWISTASYAYDVAASESRGSSVTVSRVALGWILRVGVGVAFKPRFGPPSPIDGGHPWTSHAQSKPCHPLWYRLVSR